jgi:nitroimidazol reductase NimA-like FMN-containing flavoprotein (pyridoxamine 5'-phosphate oxidase superfamily)
MVYPVSDKGNLTACSFEQQRGAPQIMSSPQIRRADRAMSDERALQTLAQGYSGRLATVSDDGFPYCIPLLYVWIDGEVYLHTTSARGHLRSNIERDDRVCFEIDEREGVFDYGRFECDSGLAYRSVCLFGRVRIVDDRETKQRFCEALMEKYGKPETRRPKRFFPRIDFITVYAIAVERMTGKEQALPPLSEQWPAKDRTKTPNADPEAQPVAAAPGPRRRD